MQDEKDRPDGFDADAPILSILSIPVERCCLVVAAADKVKQPFIDEARDIVKRCAALYRKLSGDSPAAGGLAELRSKLREVGSALQKVAERAEQAGASEGEPPEDRRGATEEGAPSAPEPARAETDTDALVAAEMQVLETGERPDEPEELGLARALSSIKLVVEEEKLVIDRADYAFVDKAPELIEGLGEAERAGDKAARIFVDCIRFMDSIEREYGLAGGGSLARTFGSLRSLLAEHLDETHGITFAPDPRVEGSETPSSLKALAGAKPVRFPSRSPAGEVIGLFKRGMATSSGTEPPEALVSSGDSSDALELVKKLSSVLTRPLDQPEDARQAKARALKQIRHKYLPELAAAAGDADAGSRADREATALRYVVNVLVPLNRDGSLDAAVTRLCADLKERGISQIPVRLGVTFDESFGTGQFERRTISSEKALGVVAALLQMGFVNRDGVPVQKAIVGVSGGPDFR